MGSRQADRATIESTGAGTPVLRRYERPREEVESSPELLLGAVLPAAEVEPTINASTLSAGSRALLRGLLRVGTTRQFAGGGVGLEYGSLLKTAARPEYLVAHVAEAADHLRQRRVDLLLVPGMSGYPVGAMYAVVAGIPALLLKKGKLGDAGVGGYPTGAFVIPSYPGEGDVVMSADPAAVADIVAGVVGPQLAAQAEAAEPRLTLRAAGADDIIDKATMSHAVGESAVAIGEAAIAEFVERHRAASGDRRSIRWEVEVVAWVTPLIKGYNRPHEILRRRFGFEPFAGVNVTAVRLDPPAIAVEGVSGLLAFSGA